MNALRRLAARAPAPVFPVLGKGGQSGLDALLLSPHVTVVDSPRRCRVLLVVGRIMKPEWDALRRLHDQVPSPRVSLWHGTEPPSELHGSSAREVAELERLPEAAKEAYRQLLAGEGNGDPDLCEDRPPAPWKGLGDGHGGEGMMGGKPYGRPMAMPEDDLRDGLQLDPMDFTLGPFSPLLPAGLVADIKLHGDVVAGFEVQSQPYPIKLAPIFARAVEQEVPIAELEMARARHHLSRLSHVLRLNGMSAYATRLLRLARDMQPGDRIPERWLRALWAFAGADQGVAEADRLRGPAARAAGWARDARAEDPAYRSLDFEVLTQQRGDCAARWQQWFDEANQSLALAGSAEKQDAMAAPAGTVETPLGPLTEDRKPADCSEILEELLIGLEWSEAVAVMASLETGGMA
ncbi:MAG: hypothetical protein ACNS61_07985 [Candidatus Wenzhouxiangella sp. M2_3B_020]